MRGGLSNLVYVVVRYKDLGNGMIESLEKYDVTEDFQELAVHYLLPATREEVENS